MTTEEKKLVENLKSRIWRIQNLYFIKDKSGKKIKFKPNKVQLFLLEHLSFFNIILKARQLGITTFFNILFLDDCLFNGKDIAIIAHTKPDAQDIFNNKIKFAFDELPTVIKNLFSVESDNINVLRFYNKVSGNRSSISVKTSGRSGSFQRLHITELSTTDQIDPSTSEEIRTGTLNTVHAGSVTVIESTPKLPSGLFFEICKTAMDNEKMGKTGIMDYKFFFFPWFMEESYVLEGDYTEIPQSMHDYFEKLKEDDWFKTNYADYKFSNEQKYWYYKKSTVQKDKMLQEFPSTPTEAFRSAVVGTYFARELDKVLVEDRLTVVPYNSRYPVDTYWDLGTTTTRKDAMSIVFVQQIGQQINIIDFFGCNGEGFPYVKRILDDKGYTYGRHWAPHDIAVKEIGTGKTRLELAADLGIRFNTVPRIGFNDGVEAVRTILSRCYFDKSKTGGEKGLFDALRNYHREYDQATGSFKDKPVKDWTSDVVDSFRMMAIGINENSEDNFKGKEESQRVDTLNPLSIF
jgi:hypothetical protein